MKVLILGATGMLGMALYPQAHRQNYTVVGVARSGSDRDIDVTNINSLQNLLIAENPDIIINTVAITNLDCCENHPDLAYMTNARPASVVARIASDIGAYSIHISTDHYYSGDGRKQHDEDDPVILINEYARTKYAAESFALTNEDSLVIRTNIVGFRGRSDNPTFVEWCIKNLVEKKPVTLFDDFFTRDISSCYVKYAVRFSLCLLYTSEAETVLLKT